MFGGSTEQRSPVRKTVETHGAVGCVKLEAGIRVIGNEPRNAKYFRQYQELKEAGRTLP